MKILAICGKAGAGKDYLLKQLTTQYPDVFHTIVSCTTRPSREGEREGIDYHFMNSDQFIEALMNDDMLEATYFRDWCYGTRKSDLKENKINIGIFNLDGIEILSDNASIMLGVIYVNCNDKTRLLRQLQREENPDVKEIIRRFTADEKDFSDFYWDSIVEENYPFWYVENDPEPLVPLQSRIEEIGQHYLNELA